MLFTLSVAEKLSMAGALTVTSTWAKLIPLRRPRGVHRPITSAADTDDEQAQYDALRHVISNHIADRIKEEPDYGFDGPSSVLEESTRYGVRMAWVVPTLLGCRDWRMWAPISMPRLHRKPILEIDSSQKYRSSHKANPEFDSGVESRFAAKWGSEKRDVRTLKHESEPRFAGQEAFFPDFAFEHESGARVLFEIIGYWTPEYLVKKREKLKQFRGDQCFSASGRLRRTNWLIWEFRRSLTNPP